MLRRHHILSDAIEELATSLAHKRFSPYCVTRMPLTPFTGYLTRSRNKTIGPVNVSDIKSYMFQLLRDTSAEPSGASHTKRDSFHKPGDVA